MPKHDMTKMDDSKASKKDSMAMDMSGSSKNDGMTKHDMSKMDDANSGNHDSMGMNMSGPDQDNDRVHSIELQLEQMRMQQAQLAQAHQREKDAQKKEDAKAHTLMEQDPRAHIVMMKMEQEHRQLALELPRLLLQHEAHIYQELQSAQAAAQAKMPETGKMMMEMVGMTRWSQIPLLVLGLWLIVSPFSLGYRSVPLIWSDVISGILVTVLAVIAFRTKRVWAAWANTFVGFMAGFRSDRFLGARCRRVCKRYFDGHAGDYICRAHPDDDDNAGTRSSAWVVVQPGLMATARAYSGSRSLEFFPGALHDRVSIRPYLLGMGSDFW